MASLLIRNNYVQSKVIYKVVFPTMEEAYFFVYNLCINPPSYGQVINTFSRSSHIILEKSIYNIVLYFSHVTREEHQLIDKKELMASTDYQDRVNQVKFIKNKSNEWNEFTKKNKQEQTIFEKELNEYVMKNISELQHSS